MKVCIMVVMAFMSGCPARCTELPVMACCSLLMSFLAAELGEHRASKCARPSRELGELYRVDAKADTGDIAIGGWRVAPGDVTS